MQCKIEGCTNKVLANGLSKLNIQEGIKNLKMRQKLVIKQLKSIMENLPLKMGHILKGVFNYIFNKNKNIAQKRYLICNKCKDRLVLGDTEYCNICGCLIKLKTTVPEENCPAHRW